MITFFFTFLRVFGDFLEFCLPFLRKSNFSGLI